VEEPRAEPFLKTRDGLADSGGRYPELPPGGGEAPSLGGFDKGVQGGEFVHATGFC